jgi:hypothetical protein
MCHLLLSVDVRAVDVDVDVDVGQQRQRRSAPPRQAEPVGVALPMAL